MERTYHPKTSQTRIITNSAVRGTYPEKCLSLAILRCIATQSEVLREGRWNNAKGPAIERRLDVWRGNAGGKYVGSGVNEQGSRSV